MSKVQFSPFLSDSECCDLHFGIKPIINSKEEKEEYDDNLRQHNRYIVLNGFPFLRKGEFIRYYCNVAFHNKEKVKQYGFRWDKGKEMWYCDDMCLSMYRDILKSFPCRVDYIHIRTKSGERIPDSGGELSLLHELMDEIRHDYTPPQIYKIPIKRDFKNRAHDRYFYTLLSLDDSYKHSIKT